MSCCCCCWRSWNEVVSEPRSSCSSDMTMCCTLLISSINRSNCTRRDVSTNLNKANSSSSLAFCSACLCRMCVRVFSNTDVMRSDVMAILDMAVACCCCWMWAI